jgi:hypothetical protein
MAVLVVGQFDRGRVPGWKMSRPMRISRPMPRLDEFLTAAEFDALEQVDEGRNRSIAKNLSDRLLELGYIEETPAGLAITSAGQMRLALGART